MTRSVILASASKIRGDLLVQSGVDFETVTADIDEQKIKQDLKGEGATPGTLAAFLAEQKALHVARERPECLVIGADQVLTCDDICYDKPKDLGEARRQLYTLQGKTHTLATAICLVQGTSILWHHLAEPRLTMRSLSAEFIDTYLARNGPEILSCVGAYQLEGEGAQLFAHIEGDYFAILGLPLLPLLDMLRSQGVLET